MTDLTKITTPFGLLDEATQKALGEHALSGKIEVFAENGWQTCCVPFNSWSMIVVRRLKPQPPKPREWFAVQIGKLHVGMWDDIEHAKRAADRPDAEIIHVREVLEP